MLLQLSESISNKILINFYRFKYGKRVSKLLFVRSLQRKMLFWKHQRLIHHYIFNININNFQSPIDLWFLLIFNHNIVQMFGSLLWYIIHIQVLLLPIMNFPKRAFNSSNWRIKWKERLDTISSLGWLERNRFCIFIFFFKSIIWIKNKEFWGNVCQFWCVEGNLFVLRNTKHKECIQNANWNVKDENDSSIWKIIYYALNRERMIAYNNDIFWKNSAQNKSNYFRNKRIKKKSKHFQTWNNNQKCNMVMVMVMQFIVGRWCTR